MSYSVLPIWLVDIAGSVLMIVLSFMSLSLAYQLRRRDPNNVIWTYLQWVCLGLACFAVSRSAGHIVKQLLLISHREAVWSAIQPFSGAVNTLSFIFVSSVTLFFERVWRIYRLINKDKQALKSARDDLLYLNHNLESLVVARTKELARSEHNYRRIFEVSRDMIVVTSREGLLLNMNPAGYQILGYEPSGIAAEGKSLATFFSDPAEWQKVRQTLDQQGYISNVEISLKDRQNRSIRSLLSGNIDKGFAEKEETIHFLIKDIEQRKIVEDQIARADKLASIGQLSAGIAHEINNPLGVILGYTQLLIRLEKENAEKLQDLKTIEKHVRSCKTIVEDLLHFARTSPPRQNSIRIDETIDEVLQFVRQHANFERIEILRNYDASVPEMLLDKEKIKQVFMNLILNARHAINDTGTLSLATVHRPDESQVEVTISDNGYGIHQQDLPRIFDPFFTTKPTGEGTGLGLSVSYGIVKNHGGDILVESEVGKGSTFTVVLPLVSFWKEKTDVAVDSHR